MRILIIKSVLFIYSILLFSGCSQEEKVTIDLVTIKAGDISLSILPNAGGRVVSLHHKENKSIIYSDSLLWKSPFLLKEERFAKPKFIGLSGHINWVGPQSDWWTQQNHFNELKNQEAVWPPDPYLIYGQYKIIDQSTESIKLIGPESKYSGIQLTKSYSANSDNSVDVNTEMLNIRDTIVNWDLWFNTRMDGFSKVYVPVGNVDEVRMEYRNGAFQEPMPHRIDNGYFYFNPENPSEGMNEKVAKSFIYPSRNRIYAFTKNELFIIEFEMYNKELTHTEHSIIEIYNSVKKNGESLLELEYHSPYKELKPGDKLVSREKWHVVEYDGDMEISSHIAAIENYEQN